MKKSPLLAQTMRSPSRSVPTAATRLAGLAATALLASSLSAQWQANSYAGAGGTNNTIRFVTGSRAGNLTIAGSFTTAGGTTNRYVSQWNGASWVPFPGQNLNSVYAFTQLANGNYLAGNGAAVYRSIGGAAWAQMSVYSNGVALFSNFVNAVTGLPNGDVIVGGNDSSPWVLNGPRRPALVIYPGGAGSPSTAANLVSNPADTVWCLEPLSATTVAVGGSISFTGTSSTSLARLSGGVLSPFSTVANPAGTPLRIRALSNGDVLVLFQTSSGTGFALQRFTGTAAAGAWSLVATPDGMINDMRELPDGDVLFVGGFSTIGGIPALGIARLSGGTTWSALATSVTGAILGVTVLEDDSIAAVGSITAIDGQAVGNIGRLPIINPGVTADIGTGCTGPGGLNVLTANNLPYLGRTFRATATGIDPTAIGMLIFGSTSPGVALPPPGGPGCMLYADQSVTVVSMPNAAGIVDASFSVPNNPSWLGQVMFEQVAGIAPSLSLITTTNGLKLKFGDI